MRGQILVAFVALISLMSAAHDDSGCVKGQDQPVPPAKRFPAIPDVFQMDIQMNVAVNKTTKHLFEVFDAPNGRAIIGETVATGPYKNISISGYEIYNFYTNQIVDVITLPDATVNCEARKLDRGDTFMFGNQASFTSAFSGRSAFMVDPKYPPVYQGKDTLDNGVMVEKWGDCHYIPIMDATVRVTWYFTDRDTWVSPLGVQVPMMLSVKGMSYHPNVKGRVIDHSYTFTGFQDFLSDRAQDYFMVPKGTICPYLKSFNVGPPQPHPLPAIAANGFFSFNAEFVQQTGDGAGLVTDIREFYDSTLKMSRYDYVPRGMLVNFATPSAANEISEIHDFTTGLAYIKDRVRGNCTVTPLANTKKFDVMGTDANHVRMKTVAEFFGVTNSADESVNWTYTGQRKVRDVLADFYIAERLGYPPGSDPKTKSIWELAFMSQSYLDVASTTEIETREPVRLWVKIPDLDYEISYNIFDFEESEPNTFRFDIGDCVPDDQKTNVGFKLPGDQKDKMENNREEFTYWLLVSTIGYMDILPSRISKLEWYADDDDVTVRFQVLDPPSTLGSTTDKIPSSYINPTADAIAVLKAGIDSGKFSVETGSLGDGPIVPVVAIAGSMHLPKHEAKDDSVCIKGQSQPVSPTKPFPAIPDVFQMDIQMNVAVNKTTKHLFEVFDAPNRRAVIGETLAAGQYKNITTTRYDQFNFYSNQIVELFPLLDGTFHCNVTQLDSNRKDTFMFGDTASSKTGFSGKSAFMIDSRYPPVYQGKDTLENGVVVEKWGDCHYIPALNATVRLMWYFNDADSWVSPLGVQVPIMLRVKGKAYDSDVKGRVIDHSYTFTGFQDFLSDRAQDYFMVPKGTICPYLKSFNVGPPQPHSLPAIAAQGFFSFNAEFVQQIGDGTGLVTDIREFYDSTLKMSRYDYVPQGLLVNFATPSAANEISEIHDFITGLAYIKDRVRGNCTVTPLANITNFDVMGTDANHVRMKTVAEFFGLTNTADVSVNWTYTGQRKVRDVLADFYIAERLGYPPGSDPKTKSIWELAFMSESYIDVARTTEIEEGEPVRLWVKIPDLDYEISYNIFDFDESEPSTFRFDIGDCIPDDQKTSVRFRLPGDQKDKMENNREEFTYWLLVSIIGYMDILPSRVTKLEWYAADSTDEVTVRFQVLDPPSILGSTIDKIPSSYMNPTADAIAVLKAGIDSGKFVVEAGSLGDGTIVPVVAIAGSMHLSKHEAKDDSVCVKGQGQPVSPTKPFPAIPDVFQMDIQMNVAINKTTKHLFEVFDAPNGRAIIGETLAAGQYKNITTTRYDQFNFYSNQIVELSPLLDGTFRCNVTQLDSNRKDTFMFGDTASSKTGFSGKSAFMIDSRYPPVYQGKDTLENGVVVEKWADRHYIPALNATVRLMWYFNDADSWVSPLGVQVPMMLSVKGKAYDSDVKGRVIDHSYTFTGFQDHLSDRAQDYFMVPKGTICPYLKSFNVGPPQPHPLPAIAANGFFSFNAEFVQQIGDGTGLVTDIREFYDSTLKMSRYDYVPQGMLVNFATPSAANEISEIHDFTTGLAYIKDRVRGNCTVTPLANIINFDVMGTDANHVRMKTVAEFFGLTNSADVSVNWTYTGQRKVRDVLADFYIAERLGYPPGSDPKTKSIWELAFMSESYIDVARTTEIEEGEPVRFWVKIPDLDYEMSYNIFDFDESEPSTFRFDIGDCVPDDQKTNVRFRLPGDQKDKMENNREEFTYWLLVSIIGYMDILPSRVTKLEWYAADSNDDVTVRFQVLDPPSILGSTVNKIPSSYMNPTADAIAVLKAGIDSGDFVAEAGSLGDGTIVPVVAIAGSTVHSRSKMSVVTKTAEQKVISAGVAAGIAVSCLVGGVGLGVLLVFVIYKVRRVRKSAEITMRFSTLKSEN